MITLFSALLAASIIADVRDAARSGDLVAAEKMVTEYQTKSGVTPESLEAYSWLARGALMAKKYEDAARYAAETRKQVLARVNAARLDDERHLPIALGAAIEVHGQALAAQESRSEAVAYLNEELARFKTTSMRARIQKNINLLSLEGKRAPKLVSAALPSSKPALLFFWAHWCGDCKATAAVIAEVQKQYPEIAVIGPTRLYGYAEGGREVGPAEEKAYISKVRGQFYSAIRNMPTPVSEETFSVYGASTTPTLVLVDAKGIVRMYHPGKMTLDELRPYLDKVRPAPSSSAHRRQDPDYLTAVLLDSFRTYAGNLE